MAYKIRVEKSFLNYLLILISSLFLAFCTPIIDHHGHKVTDDDLAKIEVGGTKFDVEDALGTPSVTALFDYPAYYYISSKIQTTAFFEPEEIDRKIIAVHFDADDFITKISKFGLKDGKIVDFINDETPATGKELSVLQQLFGNIGKFGGEAVTPGQVFKP